MDWMLSDEILTQARALVPSLEMGSTTCIEYRKATGSCQGCPAYEHCRLFTAGFMVATDYAARGIQETLTLLSRK